MSSLYFGLDVFCFFEARAPEFDVVYIGLNLQMIRSTKLLQISLSTTGHFSKFVSAVWATSADFVMRYGSMRRMKPYDFRAMGHSTGLVMRYAI